MRLSTLTPRQKRALSREVARSVLANGRSAAYELREALLRGNEGKEGGIAADDISLRTLAEETIVDSSGQPVGYRFIEDFCGIEEADNYLEAGSAVSTTAFANITGQLVFSQMMMGYMRADLVASRLIPDRPTRIKGEKIPGIGMIKDPEKDGGDILVTLEGEEYKRFGFTEEFVQMPDPEKRGLIVPVTKEAIFFDLTGRVAETARRAGEVLGLNKERRLLALIIGAVNPYQESRAGAGALTAYNTYYKAADSGPWTNAKGGVALVDWTDIEEALMLSVAMTDPATGEAIEITRPTLLTVPQLMMKARYILNATEIAVGDITTGTGLQVRAANPVAGQFNLEVSTMLYHQLQKASPMGLAEAAADADGYWFLGDFARAFSYQQIWPITTAQPPANNHADFTADIILQYKASEYGVPEVKDPRYVIRMREKAD